MIHYLYKATNTITGRCYVGVSCEPKIRINKPCAAALRDGKDKYQFQNSISKHGRESFNWEILDYTTNKSEAYKVLETCWIKEFDSFMDTEGSQEEIAR